MAATLPIGREVTLQDRYDLDDGRVMLSGVQALVRLVFDQMREDRRAGLRNGAFVSGYPGSPLGGLDTEFARQSRIAEELGIVFKTGLNEDLAATAVWGSQLAPAMDGADVEGVLGVWYGKAPGVDRSGDALRHGNFVGAHPQGGLLAICGDDPGCKSSTLPSASDGLLASLRMPVVYPGNPQEILELGRHAIALSRASGLWVGLKIVANVADAVMAVDLGEREPIRPVAVDDGGRPYVHSPNANLIAAPMLEAERTMTGPRLALARAYARENRLNRVVVDPAEARLGIVAAGLPYVELREAMATLGLDDDDLRRIGVRLLKLGMTWPLDPDELSAFATGLERILVVEEKDAMIEDALRNALYSAASRPQVLGKADERGEPLLPPNGQLDADTIARALVRELPAEELPEAASARLEVLRRDPGAATQFQVPARLPFFCSGCPHNRSTDAPEGARVGAGIGCHGMVVIAPEGKGKVQGATQMGAEGAQWNGQAPFVESGSGHLFQNLGDGTFHHSGSLAIRAAIAAGVNITYKLLYNDAIAMTGGQRIDGEMSVAAMTRALEAEGVNRIVVTTDDLGRYKGETLAPIAELRDRGQLQEAQEELASVEGVTVLIHDQACAAEQRRLRKRGLAPDPPQRLLINERVCEGCGDCGRKSHCLSLIPADTEFGRKTQIDQTSCNKDYSCLEGECPSFVSVIPDPDHRPERVAPPADLPEPALDPTAEATVRMVGIGGTGVVTVAQVLGMAAMLDGRRTQGLDQTGLAQKGGTVVSDVRILDADGPRAGRAPSESVDCYLALELIAATNPLNLAAANPAETVAVVSTSLAQTASMIGDPTAPTDLDVPLEAIESASDASRNVYLDAARLSERAFGSATQANTVMLGAAWQAGLIPVSLAALERAFELNGVAVEANLAAFSWGRAVVCRPDAVAALEAGEEETAAPGLGQAEREIVDGVGAEQDSELQRLLEVRVADLVAYQSRAYARRYADAVAEVLRAERAAGAGESRAAEAVARELHRLMAYKDEYEVARLHLDPVERARLRASFGPGAKVRYMLHPPLLKALGLKRKLALGRWFDPVFGLLRAMRRLRGTPLDPFGYLSIRRLERRLPGEYMELVRAALQHLGSGRDDLVVELCELPETIRGYDEVKLEGVARFRARAEAIVAELG